MPSTWALAKVRDTPPHAHSAASAPNDWLDGVLTDTVLPLSVELRIVAVEPSLRKIPPPIEFEESGFPSWIGYGVDSELASRAELPSTELSSMVRVASPLTKIPPPETKRPVGAVAAAELPTTRDACSESDAPEWTAIPPPFDCAGADA